MPSTLEEAAPPVAPPAGGWDSELVVLRAEDRALANTLSTLDQAVAGLRGGQPG